MGTETVPIGRRMSPRLRKIRIFPWADSTTYRNALSRDRAESIGAPPGLAATASSRVSSPLPLIRNEEIVPLPVFETYASRADLVTEIQQDAFCVSATAPLITSRVSSLRR